MTIIEQIRQMRTLLAEIAEKSKTEPLSSQQENELFRPLRAHGESDLQFHVRRILLAHTIDFLDRADEMGVTLDFTPATEDAIYDTLPCAYDYNRGVYQIGRIANRALIAKQLGSYLALTLCNMGGTLQCCERPEVPFDPDKGVLNNRILVTVALPDGSVVNTIDVATALTDTLTADAERYTFDEKPVVELLRRCPR